MKILIAGLGKSGTTALYHKVRNSLPSPFFEWFEPSSYEAIDNSLVSASSHSVVKVLTPLPAGFLPDGLESFTHRILIVRDPRDVLISALLYNSAYEYLWRYDEGYIRHCISLLEDKEKGRPVSSLKLLEEFRDDFSVDSFASFASTRLNAVIDISSERHGFYVFHYDDLVNNNWSGLSNYLNLPLIGSGEVDDQFNRVVRTRSSGSWKAWMLEEDIEFFRPLMLDFMVRFGFNDDWTVAHGEVIPKQHSSEYVLRVLNERRISEGLQPIIVNKGPS